MKFNIFLFANEESMENAKQSVLKPQDLLVTLKISSEKNVPPTYATLAGELYMSVSEVHAAARRAEKSRLLSRSDEGLFALKPALLEFVLHGVKYAFPPTHGGLVRGMPTGFAGPTLKKHFSPDSEILQVWPDPDGDVRGISFLPLYPSVPRAARADADLYDLLTLVDALRGGAAREREVAAQELRERLA